MTATKVASYLYAYGFVRAGFDPGRAPAGLDDSAIAVVTRGQLGALVSRLPADAYGPELIEQRSGDVSWLSPRAMAHDRVLTWAQEHGGVVPLPMFSLWGDEDALQTTLAEKQAMLARLFARVADADEFGLRVYRRDAVMQQSMHEVDADIARLKAEAEAASPGQRYLLERKVAEQSKAALRSTSQAMAKRIFDELRALSRDAVSRPLTSDASGRGGAADGTLVLNGAFLVERDRLNDFRAAVGAHVREYQPRGLSFDFTGPWPPYNFVADVGGAPAARS